MPANTVLMVRPVRFGLNESTAENNSFQSPLPQFNPAQLQELALLEFDNFVRLLRAQNIEVIVVEDTPSPHTPDSIFPNNWFITYQNGLLHTFPMASPNRRTERREDITEQLSQRFGYKIDPQLEQFEQQQMYLEGTGSVLLDRKNKLLFASLSVRTHPKVLQYYLDLTGYEAVIFETLPYLGHPVYHTNVVLSLADRFAILGLETVVEKDRKRLVEALEKSGRTIIELSNEQIYQHFAGNMIQLQNPDGQRFLVMSSNAHRSLTKDQLYQIEQTFENQIIAPPLNIIETLGGGSARCMLAEIFY